MIPFKKINLSESIDRIKPLIDSGYIGLGNVVYDFEKKLAQYVGTKEAVAFDSCTSALFISLLWEKMHDRLNPKLVIPSMTVPLVACAIREAGVDFMFNRETSWVGSEYQLMGSLIFDSAHELRRNQWKENGHNLDAEKICFSFYPTKTIGSADGGAVATNDVEFAEWARKIITYGRNQQKNYGNSWDYDVEMFGYKRHWTNLQAAIALEQLERLDSTANVRNAIRRRYNRELGLSNTSEYLYRINVSDQNKFIEFMKSKEIECGVHFKPLHLMKPFSEIAMDGVDRAQVERAYRQTVSLPFFDMMTDREVTTVIDAVQESGMLI